MTQDTDIYKTPTHTETASDYREGEEIAVPTRCFSALTGALATLCSKAVEMIRRHALPSSCLSICATSLTPAA